MRELLRSLPSTEASLQALLGRAPDLAQAPRPQLLEIIRTFWEQKREAIRMGAIREAINPEREQAALAAFARKRLRPRLRRVLNGAGVVIHTNLGRSILAREACEAVQLAASGYCSLEMDLATGARGSRHSLVSGLVASLTGAEDAMVVNNNAAAVLLILDSLCAGGEVIVSRGELVEIGGSFRIPDIMAKSGATLREVGATNRVHLRDYRDAINANTRAIMRVHASNFRIVGFHSAVPLTELKKLAVEHDLPLIFDLGSGSLIHMEASGLPPEPLASEILAQGADLICFSGDKALGGPQAGIIAGKASLVASLKQNPLARALRCDKLCLAALEATLRLYLDAERAKSHVPTVAMLNQPAEALAKNAHTLARALRRALRQARMACELRLLEDTSRAGGGSYPEYGLPTTLVALRPQDLSIQELRARLLDGEPAVVGRLEKDFFCLDPRTLAKKDYPLVVHAVMAALGREQGPGRQEQSQKKTSG